MRMNKRIAAAAVAVLMTAGLAGCSGSSSAVSDANAGLPQATGYEDRSVPESVPGAPYTESSKKLARSARVSLRVTDVSAAAAAISGLARSLNGSVTGENLVTSKESDGSLSTVVIAVPSAKLESALDQLRPIGTMTSRNVESEDVSEVVADVDSRVETLTTSLERLRELSRKAGSIKELTSLEEQITQRTAERDSLLAQQRVLAKRVAEADITITLYTESAPPPPAPTGFLAGLLAGWEALLYSTQILLQVIGALLPFALAVGVVAIPVVVLLRRRRRSGPASPAAGPTASADAPAAAMASSADAGPVTTSEAPADQSE